MSLRTLHRGWSFGSMLQDIKKKEKSKLVHYSQDVFHYIRKSPLSSVKVLLRMMKVTSGSIQPLVPSKH